MMNMKFAVTSEALCRYLYNVLILQVFLGIFTQTQCRKVNYLHREIIPIKTDDGKPVSDNVNIGKLCTDEFETIVDKCMNTFVHEVTSMHQLRVGTLLAWRVLYRNTHSQPFCMKYEQMLLCLHESLKKCDTEDSTSLVQNKLNVPWVMKTNKRCNINVKNNTRYHEQYSSMEKASDKDRSHTANKYNRHLATEETDNVGENIHSNDNLDYTGLQSESLRFQRTILYKVLFQNHRLPIQMEMRVTNTDTVSEIDSYAQSKGVIFSTQKSAWKTKIGKLLFEKQFK